MFEISIAVAFVTLFVYLGYKFKELEKNNKAVEALTDVMNRLIDVALDGKSKKTYKKTDGHTTTDVTISRSVDQMEAAPKKKRGRPSKK